jgi:hypothetical protein
MKLIRDLDPELYATQYLRLRMNFQEMGYESGAATAKNLEMQRLSTVRYPREILD